MEAFSLLKYWRGGGAANVRTPTPTTITSAVPRPTIVTDEEDDDDDDEGPFFDLEFTVPDDRDEGGDDDEDEEEEEDGSIVTDEEREFGFTVSSAGSDGQTDPNLNLSPSDDLFFKGKLVPLEPSSLAYNLSEPNSRPQFPVSLIKSATKFRVFIPGFKKPKPSAGAEANVAPVSAQKQQNQQQQNRFFTVKFKVEEVPIVSLFTRDNSSRNKTQKQQPQQQADDTASVEDGGLSASDAKRFAKVVMQKYLKMIKPLYVKVSRRYGEKLRFSGQLSLGLGKATTVMTHEAAAAEAADRKPEAEAAPPAMATAAPPPANLKNQKQGNLPAGLRVVCKHLGKSRSASSAVAAVPTLPPQVQRRDDSLLQQQDGIQSAIAHCKRSFNVSKESEIFLPRSSSDTCAGKSIDVCSRNSTKGKEYCL